MHESFHVDDPTKYSREWSGWANMMFRELVLDYYDLRIDVRNLKIEYKMAAILLYILFPHSHYWDQIVSPFESHWMQLVELFDNL